MRHKRSWFCILLSLFLMFLTLDTLVAQQAQAVRNATLENGLEVFVVENHVVPLVTVCIAFRGGAIAHSPETAGLFHLYEHMMFNGNDKYPTKDAFSAALNRMGTTSWNGATGREYINYFISVPSEKLTDAIDFWAHAVINPTLDARVLENEKQVVLNEIRGYHSDPSQIALNGLESRMFRGFPWRKNIDGPESNITRANVTALRDIQKTYYVPSNMALLIGGDTSLEEVVKLANESFGSWARAPEPLLAEPPHGPIPDGIRLVTSEDQFYRGIAQVEFRWRGPDVTRQTYDTYISDVLLFLLSSPSGPFKSEIMRKVYGLYDAEYIDFVYPTSRDGGNYIFATLMLVQRPAEEEPVLQRVENLKSVVLDEFALIAKDPSAYFGGDEALEEAKTKLVDQNIYALESSGSFVTDTLTFWWSTAGTEYFFDYEENCRKVSWEDISSLIERYLAGESNPNVATLVRLRTSTLNSDPRMDAKISELGYSRLTAQNAFWWQKQ
ncbi:MAG TPA: pitrilysin family protein [Rectinema sp.]|nr:pitrilysin family protein [Rectinema sp.]HPD69749.1 pitrilysin family protein [Rectinema sp.]